ncbi:hypothetical protein CYLTODRAFT_170932 [Cylindrobasidium torrendii FP15055 ss-10]|uniref:Secreted protein n=1 Tax=Cylindrobasidium torrendii FP15055 ss-10 TaxID=1314674 RepID=A0A0D7AW08_9AGAR|nr:hypothetical protein CYLTODRAFT_170932 [Cylindrobasidium torrendii FP15055 ss-10]
MWTAVWSVLTVCVCGSSGATVSACDDTLFRMGCSKSGTVSMTMLKNVPPRLRIQSNCIMGRSFLVHCVCGNGDRPFYLVDIPPPWTEKTLPPVALGG